MGRWGAHCLYKEVESRGLSGIFRCDLQRRARVKHVIWPRRARTLNEAAATPPAPPAPPTARRPPRDDCDDALPCCCTSCLVPTSAPLHRERTPRAHEVPLDARPPASPCSGRPRRCCFAWPSWPLTPTQRADSRLSLLPTRSPPRELGSSPTPPSRLSGSVRLLGRERGIRDRLSELLRERRDHRDHCDRQRRAGSNHHERILGHVGPARGPVRTRPV